MSGSTGEVIELHGRQSCHYQLANPWTQPLGRIAEFLRPILLDPQSYVVEPQARLVSANRVGVNHRHRIVEETLHLKELDPWRRRRLRLRSLLPARERIEGPVCSLVDSRDWCGSYYHWFLDALPRLLYAQDHSRRSGRVTRLIVPAQLTPWQSASLGMLGSEEQHRLPHQPVGGGGLAVDQLIAGVAHRWQRQGQAPFDAASAWAIRQLAERLSQAVPLPATQLPSRLYLSRRGVTSRGVANEAEVLALLAPHGFVLIQPETLSLAEQIALFRGASHVVSPHGASLTNLLHMRQGSVLELFQEGHGVRPDFFQLAMINGLDYLHALCPSSGPGGQITVPLSLIHAYLALSL